MKERNLGKRVSRVMFLDPSNFGHDVKWMLVKEGQGVDFPAWRGERRNVATHNDHVLSSSLGTLVMDFVS